MTEATVLLPVLSLLPVLAYAVTTWRRTTVLVYGFGGFALLGGGWALSARERGDPLAGAWVFYGWVLALGAAGAGGVRDFARR